MTGFLKNPFEKNPSRPGSHPAGRDGTRDRSITDQDGLKIRIKSNYTHITHKVILTVRKIKVILFICKSCIYMYTTFE